MIDEANIEGSVDDQYYFASGIWYSAIPWNILMYTL